MHKVAGSDYYRSATHGNWKSLDMMLIMASGFIAQYLTDLQKGEMPDSFEASFNDKKATFETALQNYSDTKINVQKSSGTKTAANNAVYASLVELLQDAKAIYRNNAANKKQFTYVKLAKLVSKKGKGGFRITMKEEITLLPVTTATFLFQPGNIKVYVNNHGIAEVHLQKGIEYNATVTSPGYNTVELTNLQVTAGVMHHMEILVKKVAAVA